MLRDLPRATAGLAVAAFVLSAALAGPADAEAQYQVHGYFTQGYAISSDHEVLGIPTGGTTDFRRAALQFRMLPNDQDQLVLQFRERRLGTSAVNELGDETISLDWAFAQRTIGAYELRAGRMPLPRGIYNQIRDVGVINPFYRAPYNFHTESFETVEGLQARGEFRGESEWSADLALFGGETYYKDVNPSDGSETLELRAKRVFGGQLWIGTPVNGLRVGAAHISFEAMDAKFDLQQYSLDGNFDRFLLRGEYGYLGGELLKRPAYYVQAGAQLHPLVWAYGMYERTDAQVVVPGLPSPPFPPGIGPWTSPSYAQSKDLAGSLVVKPTAALALKLELHHNEGYNYPVAMQPFPVQPPGYPVLVPADDPLTTNYFIASVSIAF